MLPYFPKSNGYGSAVNWLAATGSGSMMSRRNSLTMLAAVAGVVVGWFALKSMPPAWYWNRIS